MQPHTGVDITHDEELAPWHRPSDGHTQEKMFQIMARVRGDRDSADHRSNLSLKPSTVKRALLAADMNVELAIAWLGDHPTRLFLNHSDLTPIAGVTLIQRVTEVFQISRILPVSSVSSPLPSISFSAGRRSFSMQGGSAGHPNRTHKCKESRGQQGGMGATRGDQAFPSKTCCSHAARRPGRCAPMRRAAGTRSHAHDHAGFRVQTAHSEARRDAQPQSAGNAVRRDRRRHPPLQQPRGPLSPHCTQFPVHSEFCNIFTQRPKSLVRPGKIQD